MNRASWDSLVEKFWDSVCKADCCSEWTGLKNRRGYGRFWDTRKMVGAHRFSWQLHFGPIPKGKFVLHSCNNPPCVRPDHLYLGTHDDNMRFMIECDRQAKGIKHHKAKLTEHDVLEIRNMTGKLKDIALIYGISLAQVSVVRRRGFWKHLV